ncbi:MAG: hypothetical protein ABIJ39_01285 [Chloroflexota bacterium]
MEAVEAQRDGVQPGVAADPRDHGGSLRPDLDALAGGQVDDHVPDPVDRVAVEQYLQGVMVTGCVTIFWVEGDVEQVDAQFDVIPGNAAVDRQDLRRGGGGIQRVEQAQVGGGPGCGGGGDRQAGAGKQEQDEREGQAWFHCQG